MKNFLSLPSLLMGINFTILSFMLLVRALLKMLTKEASDGIVTLGLGFCASILALVIVRFAIFPYVKGIQNNCNEKENSNTEK